MSQLASRASKGLGRVAVRSNVSLTGSRSARSYSSKSSNNSVKNSFKGQLTESVTQRLEREQAERLRMAAYRDSRASWNNFSLTGRMKSPSLMIDTFASKLQAG